MSKKIIAIQFSIFRYLFLTEIPEYVFGFDKNDNHLLTQSGRLQIGLEIDFTLFKMNEMIWHLHCKQGSFPVNIVLIS